MDAVFPSRSENQFVVGMTYNLQVSGLGEFTCLVCKTTFDASYTNDGTLYFLAEVTNVGQDVVDFKNVDTDDHSPRCPGCGTVFSVLHMRDANHKSPKDFASKFPYDSIFRQNEPEIIANNIMVIMAHTDNVWRQVAWEEYREVRIRDGNFNEEMERTQFNRVAPYTTTARTALEFCPTWLI